jgi:hypothetical protein
MFVILFFLSNDLLNQAAKQIEGGNYWCANGLISIFCKVRTDFTCIFCTYYPVDHRSPGQPSKITGIQSIVYGVASGFLQLPGFLFPISSTAHAAFTRAPERDMVT